MGGGDGRQVTLCYAAINSLPVLLAALSSGRRERDEEGGPAELGP
jgi:hypothetical protein